MVKKLDASGEPIRGDREIDEAQAGVVRRIFEQFACGVGPRSIAKALNAEGIVGPDGSLWNDTTIRGRVKRGTGIINNELYVGRLVWNRQRYIKDPSTGRRVSRMNPESEWIVTEVPELRIIDDEAWQSVKARQREVADKYANVIEGRTGGPFEPPERPTPAEGAVFRADLLRGLWRSVFVARPGPLCLLGPCGQWLLRQ